ncbi:DUF2752 domain-containing protein [candidate division KSB1 bacterium]
MNDFGLLVLCGIMLFLLYQYETIIDFVIRFDIIPAYLLSGCIFKMATGIPCPLCGFSRSLYETVDGNVASAIALHPLGPLFVLLLAAVILDKAVQRMTGRRLITKYSFKTIKINTLIIFVLVWILRLLFFDLAHHPII